MPERVQFFGAAQPRGAGADDRDREATARRRHLGCHPALGECAVGDGLLQRLNRYRRTIESHRAASFARRRAYPPGDFRQVVGRREERPSLAPLSAKDEVVKVGDEVVDGATGSRAGERSPGMAERNAAVHAAPGLRACKLVGADDLKLLVVRKPFVWVALGSVDTGNRQKIHGVAHAYPPAATGTGAEAASFALAAIARSYSNGMTFKNWSVFSVKFSRISFA